MARYSLTVYIAEAGTPCVKEDGTPDTSKLGHMWVSLNNSTQGIKECYGLHPQIDGNPYDNGEIKTNDNYTYQVDQNPNIRKYDFDLNEWEYKNLREYCQDQRINHPKYAGSVSDCVHWTFNVLKEGAIIDSNAPTCVLPGLNESRLKEAEKWWRDNHSIYSQAKPDDQTQVALKDERGINPQEVALNIKDLLDNFSENRLNSGQIANQQASNYKISRA